MQRVDKLAKQVEELNAEYSRLNWVKYTAGYDMGIQEAYEKITDLVKDKDNLDLILELKEKTRDEFDLRKLDVMYNFIKNYHKSEDVNALLIEINDLTNKLSNILNTFRFKIDGVGVTSATLHKIMSEDEDREKRKEAYMAQNQINEVLVDAGFIELINMRKKLSILSGYKNFVEYKLEEDELSQDVFASFRGDLKKLLPKIKTVRSSCAKEFIASGDVMPWDERFIQSKLAPILNTKVDMSEYFEKLNNFFLKFGFDLTKYNITYDIFPRRNKSEWGYNFPIECGKDSRILANVQNKYREYGVLLHETGHGLHSFLLDAEQTVLNIGVSGIVSEGIANLFGGFLYEPIFYTDFFDGQEVDAQFKKLKEWNEVNSLRAIHRIVFDQELYLRELTCLEDINNLYFELYSELFEEERFAKNPPWAFLIHHTTHPIYLHNYFMGDVTCAMVKDVFCNLTKVDSVAEKPRGFGAFVKAELIDVSGLHPYEELFKRISREEFSLKYML
ncbi:MAG: M3 family metallopeptidase [Acidaminobacteraceae bacterium]